MIEIIKYFLIGIIQGITEVLPISSSAHLIIFGDIFKINNTISYELFLHIASLVAVIIYLRKEVLIIISGAFRYLFLKDKMYFKDFYYIICLIISTLIASLFSFLFSGYLDKINNYIFMIGILLIVNGIMLFICNNLNKNNKKEIKVFDAVIIGLFEGFGTLPGISRSGSCLSGTNIRNIDKEEGKKYAFLLFIPAVIGAIILKFTEVRGLFISDVVNVNYIISFIASFISTFFSFIFLSKIIKKYKITIFGYYTIFLGIIVFLYYI